MEVRSFACPDSVQLGVDVGALIQADNIGSRRVAVDAVGVGARTVGRLKEMGLSIDDFGTGYSSLVELFRMPFNELKIDKSLVMEVHMNEEAKLIVRSIVDLAHNLGLRVCAEGTETIEAMDFVQAIGCELTQGYYVSKPLPPDDLAALIVARTWG